MASSTTVFARQTAHTPSPSLDSRRQGYISSAVPFQAARADSLAPGSGNLLYGSRSSSTQTLGAPAGYQSESMVNPIHTIYQANGIHPEGVHIVKVTGDTVQLESGPIASAFLHKVGHSLSHIVSSSARDMGEHHIGPPPPSPPASVERIEEENACLPPPTMQLSKSDPGSRPVTFDEPIRDREVLYRVVT